MEQCSCNCLMGEGASLVVVVDLQTIQAWDYSMVVVFALSEELLGDLSTW